MTTRNSLKRRVRARMARTGESYSAARRVLLGSTPTNQSSSASSLTVALAQPHNRTGELDQDLDSLFRGEVIPDCDVLVLPELIGGHNDPEKYQEAMRVLAKKSDCYVVGGSCYVPGDDGLLNAGIVVDASGAVVSEYEKIRPYGSENSSGITGGTKVGKFELAGRAFAVLICSDLWFSKTFTSLDFEPDTLLIPAFSITQRGGPNKARELWKHMLVSRAYEYSAYVGVCDWAHPCEFDGLSAAGVSGFADPRPNSESFYEGNGDQKFRSYELDFARLDSFRENRADRGFSSSTDSRG